MKKSVTARLGESAFSLVEVVIALGICSFCLLAMLGLLSVGLNTNRDTVSQTEAAGIARMVQADLLSMTATDNSSPRFKIPALSNAGHQPAFYVDEGGEKVSDAKNSRYRVDVSYGKVSNPQSAIPVYILVTWPGAANASGDWPTKQNGQFESVTALPLVP